MSAKLKTDSRVILTKNPSRELIWSQTIMMKMMKILHFHVKTVVLNLLKKNMSYHICARLGMLENLKKRVSYKVGTKFSNRKSTPKNSEIGKPHSVGFYNKIIKASSIKTPT